MRTAPSRQATVRSSSITAPGIPEPSPLVERRTFTRSVGLPSACGHSNQAPGNGDSPRMWSCTCSQGRAQSMRVSCLSILFAYVMPVCGCGVSVSEPRSSAPSARTIKSAPSRASRSYKSPAVASGSIRTRSAMAMGPVSRPWSIFITITPVSRSPASIARCRPVSGSHNLRVPSRLVLAKRRPSPLSATPQMVAVWPRIAPARRAAARQLRRRSPGARGPGPSLLLAMIAR